MKNSNSQNTTGSRLLKILTIACFATAAFFGLRALAPQSHGMLASATAESSPKVELTKPHSSLETQNIEDIRLGQRVVGTNPLREQTLPASNIDPATWRAIRLTMMQAGVQYNLAFLRPLSWIENTGAHVGNSIHLQMPELLLDGPAEVIAVDPCPEIEADGGTGRNVVTGTMAHLGANILYLDITGFDEPLGVTDNHPIWSETHQDFVVAGQLEDGEQFRTLTGESATLTKIHPHRGPPQMVFNLEVDGQHVYTVSQTGLMVHNSYMTGDQIALKELVDEVSNRAHKPLPPSIAETILDWADEVDYPKGSRSTLASAADLNPFSNHWTGGPHIHIDGVGSGHIPVLPGVQPR